MEASEPVPAAAPAEAAAFDVSPVHAALDQAEETYHSLFDGKVPDEHHRFKAFLSTVRMIVDQSADTATKETV